jgi:hypothetical protein
MWQDDEDAHEPLTVVDHVGRILLREQRADPVTLIGRGVLLLLLLLWTWSLGTASIQSNKVGESFLHVINLVFHEAGHILFIPFGGFMTSLGGSLTQVLIPLALTGVFLTKHRDPFGAAATWWWTGENLLDLAPYINDARDLQLVLLGGRTGAEVEGHDWERILMSLGWLHLDHTLARLAHMAGVLIMLSALVWGVALVAAHWQRSRSESAAGPHADRDATWREPR